MNQELTRWQKFYSDDPTLGAVAASVCSERARNIFAANNKRLILDLGCGTGRDTVNLAAEGIIVVGADAAYSGLVLAQQRSSSSGHVPSYTASVAPHLPFSNDRFEGVYCFGLLHEFVGASSKYDVIQVMAEIHRVLKPLGLVVLTVLAGEPDQGLPHVQLFTEKMFEDATSQFHCIEKEFYNDISCTGKSGYPIWYGQFIKTA